MASSVIQINQTFYLSAQEALRNNVTYATDWFTNDDFEQRDVHFRLLITFPSTSSADGAELRVQICTGAQRDSFMTSETPPKHFTTRASRGSQHVVYAPYAHAPYPSHHQCPPITKRKFLNAMLNVAKTAVQMVALTFRVQTEVSSNLINRNQVIVINELPYESYDIVKFGTVGSSFKLLFMAQFSVPGGLKTVSKATNRPSEVLSKLHDGLLSDVTLRVADMVELRAHRSVLAANSPVFSSMFHHDLVEKQVGVVDIKRPDNVTFVRAEVMEAALRHMYGKEIGDVDANTFADLLVLADQYELSALKAECEDFLSTDTSLDALELVTIAFKHRAERLKEATISRIVAHPDRKSLYSSSAFQEMMKSHADIIQELFNRM